MFRRFLPLILVLWTITPRAVGACPFCAGQGETLLSEAAQADMILFGSLGGAKEAMAGDGGDGTTVLTIETVIKDNAFRAGKMKLTLPRYIAPAPGYKFLVFCSIFKGKLDPYKGIAVKAKSDMAKYLKGALERKKEPIEKRLRFAFDYLDNADAEVSNDAFKEFANANYSEYATMAKDLPAKKIAGWLRDKNTANFRYGLYGSLLGHCGKAEDAALLRKMVDDPEKRAGSGVDGMLAGYVMLKPDEGWKYVASVLANEKNDFLFRYAALRTARFFHDIRTDLIKADQVIAAVTPMIAEKDIADLVIEDLRKWNRFELTGKVLALKGTPVFEVPIVRRAVLRFALSAKGNKDADAYVAVQRKADPDKVKDAEELLRLEQQPAK